jgi:hypothetical protein
MQLNDHRTAAKTEDHRIFKISLPLWQVWTPPLSRDSKLGRGMAHDECARYLCPAEVDWNDEV